MNKETIYSAKNQKSNQGRITPRSPHGACVSRIQFTASHNDITIVIAIIIIIITVEQQESIPLLHTATMFCTMQFYSMHLCQITRLQQIQNSLARAVVKAPKFSHTTPILRSLTG